MHGSPSLTVLLLDQRQQQQALLGAIAQRIQMLQPLPGFLAATTAAVRQYLKVDRVLVCQLDSGISGTIVAASGVPDVSGLGCQVGHPSDLGRGLANHAPLTMRVIDDAAQDNLSEDEERLLQEWHVQASLMIPIVTQGQNWGYLWVHQCLAPRRWQSLELELLEQVVVQIAIAIQQATMHEQLQAELSQRQQLNATLKQSESRFQAFMDHNPALSWITDEHGQLLYLSQTYLQSLHLDTQQVNDVVGKTAFDLYPPNIAQPLVDNIRQVATTQQPIQTIEQAPRADGTLGKFLVYKFPLEEASGQRRVGGVAIDITAHQQTEYALQHSETILRLFAKYAPAGIAMFDRTLCYLMVSQRWIEDYQLESVESIIGRSHYEVFPEIPDRWRQIHQRCLTGAVERCEEDLFVRADGRQQWLHWEVHPWYTVDQEIGGIIIFSEDITQRKQTATILQDSEERLRLALTATQQGLYDVNLQTGQIIVNAAYATMLGYDPTDFEETIDRWIERLHPDDRDRALDYYRAYSMGEIPDYRSEFRQRTREGGWKWILSVGQIVDRDADGQPLRMLGTHTDITERKQADAERQKAEKLQMELNLLENILEIILAGYWDWDIPGHQQYLSPTLKRMFGYTDDELPNKPETWQRLIVPDDLLRVTECLQQHIQSRGRVPYYNEVRYRHKNGSIVWVICSGRVINWDQEGNPLRMIGCHIDITERKRAEEALAAYTHKVEDLNEKLAIANAELAQATHLKDEFLANMSHELRTPLNAILGISESLQEGVLGSLNHPQEEAVALVERSGRHLLALINDILDLSKIESGKLELELGHVAIRGLCDTALMFVQALAHKKTIRLSKSISDDIGLLAADHRRLCQVLINLLNNAIKFTPEGGSVTLEVWRQVEGDDNPFVEPTAWVVFSVVDTGIGIAPPDIPKLFQPFVQIDSRLNRQCAGTGLGLSLVRRIAELHGGDVSVSSKLGQGSRFTVRMPDRMNPMALGLCHHGASHLSSCASTTPSQGSNTSTLLPVILLVEDNEANVQTVSTYLEMRGYQCIIAGNGQEAIEVTQTQSPDLILMDIQMPGMDGLEAIQRIRQDPKFVDVPIIALTALAMAGDREKCLAAGATEYLTKPTPLKQLVTVIQQLLDASEPNT